jgi:hypothetical protein
VVNTRRPPTVTGWLVGLIQIEPPPKVLKPSLATACGLARITVSVEPRLIAGRGVTVLTLLAAARSLTRTVVSPLTVNCGSTSTRKPLRVKKIPVAQ